MELLEGAIRAYAWGSRTDLAELQGRPAPTEHPEAEIWFGAHPADPAMLIAPKPNGDRVEERSLLAAIDADPEGRLGEKTSREFHDRLPFLLKLLAAAEPLSLQAHPSLQQAREGFASDTARRIPMDSPIRNYKDDSHKPELMVAISEFHALAGFRRPEVTLEFLEVLGVEEMAPYLDMLARQPDESGLRTLFTSWITLPQPRLRALLPALLDGCARYLTATDSGARFAREAGTIADLGSSYPGDPGVLAATLLNRVVLQPGEGLFLAAGNLHAYLLGVGVEIMANSDNVLRGGLTPKHVDVPELLRVLDFRPIDAPVLTPGDGTPGWFDTPASEFQLGTIAFDGPDNEVRLAAGYPRIVLCTHGCGLLTAGETVVELPCGSAAWLDAGDSVDVRRADAAGRTLLYVASPGR